METVKTSQKPLIQNRQTHYTKSGQNFQYGQRGGVPQRKQGSSAIYYPAWTGAAGGLAIRSSLGDLAAEDLRRAGAPGQSSRSPGQENKARPRCSQGKTGTAQRSLPCRPNAAQRSGVQQPFRCWHVRSEAERHSSVFRAARGVERSRDPRPARGGRGLLRPEHLQAASFFPRPARGGRGYENR